jgi:nuclear protein localization family protein 4
LYGRYTSDEYIPLGITANVAAIYEPPQTNTPDGIQLESDPNQETVDRIANLFGLEKVGNIFFQLGNHF